MVYLAESRIVHLYNILLQNGQILSLKCAPQTRTPAFIRRRRWLIAAPMIDWSNCAHSILTKMQT